MVGGTAGTGAAVRWDMEALSVTPRVWEDPNRSVEGVKAIFYEGLPWKGRPTRVFAYCGLPEVPRGEKVPAMVLVHGGGGSAFIPWVKLWVERGYAAIAMDTCGCISSGGYRDHPRHEWGGPPGWGGFDQLDWPIEDQWTYHAVADVILAHSLIRSMPEVDAERTGVTGISWGGYLTCIVAGVDSRFKFAVPVYGCGFLGDNSTWLGTFENLGPEKARLWLEQWDPSQYLGDARMPMLWVTGTNDFAYPMDSLQKSYRRPQSARTLCLRVRMAHAHGGPGENPEEIRAMADAILKDGAPLARVTSTGRHGREVWATFVSEIPIVQGELNYTTDTGNWQERDWQTIPATLEPGTASATLPEGTTVYYFNLIDQRDLVVSSEHEEP
ncbi:alpha/beta hydrolase family protein [Anaerobaca lacustris]|uniref:Acetylxylan esterase n=1 Tax=Anaerobaca lacustris TaxID=3044600 RepID=A0AAW6U195_9BACT|nr:acetylxylan esterase [Sedimentisphaerales bacterium M17dextr]